MRSTVFNFLWAFVAALFFPQFISDETLGFSNSVFSVLMFAVILILLNKSHSLKCSKRLLIFSHSLGFFLSLMIASGHSLDVFGSISFSELSVSIIFYTHVIASLINLLWTYLISFDSLMNNLEFDQSNSILVTGNKIISWIASHPYIITLILLICWMPAFIADYPGGFRYDATGELFQYRDGYNGDYPMLHSVIISRFVPWVYELTGTYNTGIAIYVVVQMILAACMYTHILCYFKKRGLNNVLFLLALLYCGMFPVIQMLVVQEVRDVLFSLLLTYTIFLFYMMTSERQEFFSSKIKPAALGLVFTLAILARNNNAGPIMLIAIVAVSLIVWIVNRKKNLKGATIFAFSCILSYLIIGGCLTMLCQPLTPATEGASLSVMSQTITRAYEYKNDKWTDEEKAELAKYVSMDGLKYYSEIADPTKARLMIDGNFSEFFAFWLKIGRKYPGIYLDAILANTQNMWYPDSVIDGYKQVFKEEGQPYYEWDKCYYSISNNVAPPAEHANMLPAVLDFYSSIGLRISFEKIPVVSMMFSIGFQCWIVMNCLLYLWYRRLDKYILPVGILFAYILISSFVPIVILRYFAALFFSMPMIMIFTLNPTYDGGRS